MTGNELRKALQNGGRVYGTLIVSTSPKWSLAVSNTGVDFVFIDTEHIAIGRETLSWMCRTYAAMNIPPIVRIPSPDPFEACKVLDGGACGIVAPYVESAEEVRALVGATKLRPLKGEKLTAALHDPATLSPQVHDYLHASNADNLLIVNIESVPALDNLDEILRVPGLDGVLIGPHDLSISLGIPEQYQNPIFDRAVRDIIKRARSRNIGAGIHFSSGLEQELAWVQAGANLIVHSGDITLFEDAMRCDLTTMHAALGDETANDAAQQTTVI